MSQILSGVSLFSIVLTLIAYEIGLWVKKKCSNPIFNPILVGLVLVIAFLLAFRIPVEQYQAGCGMFSWLLTPATVCLAIPLYDQLQILKRNLPAVCAGVAAGTVVSLACVGGMCVLFGLDKSLTATLLPKSITTAMGIVISEQMGGVPAITTVIIVATGILGSVFGTTMCNLFRITDPIAQGVAFGTASHVVGTSRAAQLSDLTGAVSSLSLVVAGILTAVLCPLIFPFL